jgi:hypothetical protein
VFVVDLRIVLLKQFTDHIGCKVVLITGFQIRGFHIDKKFAAGFQSCRDPIGFRGIWMRLESRSELGAMQVTIRVV